MSETTGFFGLNVANDLLRKVEYQLSILPNYSTKDKAYLYLLWDICCTLYHIKDWLRNDENLKLLGNTEKDRCIKLNKYFSTDKQPLNNEFCVIQSMCNRSKHFKLTKKPIKNIKTKNTTKGTYYGEGYYGEGYYGGQYMFYVEYESKTYDLIKVIKNIVGQWKKFYRIHKMKY